MRWDYRKALVWTIALACIVCAVSSLPSSAENVPVLTTVRDIRLLTPDQAAQARPVHLRGVVTVLPGVRTWFFLQDATAGISIERTYDPPVVQQGQLVEVDGYTGPGKFAPVVTAKTVKIVGKGELPPARIFTSNMLVGGKQDAQWVAFRGIVRSAAVKTLWERQMLFLEMDIGGGYLVTVRIAEFSPDDVHRLAGASVRVRGVCGTNFDDKRQFLGVILMVQNSATDVTVERPPTADPFDIPPHPMDALLRFDDPQGAIERIKTHGVVTYADAGQGIYIQDGSKGLFVRSRQPAPPVGSRVDVIGFPSPGNYSPQLQSALLRILGPGKLPDPVPQWPSAMITERDGFVYAPYDAVLVQLKAVLVDEIPRANEDLLIFKDGPIVFNARLPRAEPGRHLVPPGSLVTLTGVCVAKANELHEPTSFEILLRSPADVVILKRGPWWNAPQAGWVVALLLIALLITSSGLFISRRQAALRALTVTDPLTGVLNRRGFLLFAENQRQLAMRRGSPLQVFYIDIDQFKKINDSLGHHEGDMALRAVAIALKKAFRKTDIIGRIGGDEFAVVAVDAPADFQSFLEEQIVHALDHANETSRSPFELSLSYGVAIFDGKISTRSIEGLLAAADESMYRHKYAKAHQSSAKTPQHASM